LGSTGKVTVNTAPVVWTGLGTDDQEVEGAKIVEVVNIEAAPLNGHCNRKFDPVREGFMKSGAAMPPTASATGRTLPPTAKNDAVL
jgi:hypothetical protein